MKAVVPPLPDPIDCQQGRISLWRSLPVEFSLWGHGWAFHSFLIISFPFLVIQPAKCHPNHATLLMVYLLIVQYRSRVALGQGMWQRAPRVPSAVLCCPAHVCRRGWSKAVLSCRRSSMLLSVLHFNSSAGAELVSANAWCTCCNPPSCEMQHQSMGQGTELSQCPTERTAPASTGPAGCH